MERVTYKLTELINNNERNSDNIINIIYDHMNCVRKDTIFKIAEHHMKNDPSLHIYEAMEIAKKDYERL